MTPRHAYPSRPSRASRCLCWLALLVVLLGSIVSSIGAINSHGVAAMTATLHESGSAAGDSHGHVHEDDDDGLLSAVQGATGEHPHHGTDHSHDKAQALPAAWGPPLQVLPARIAFAQPWTERIRASRLERPPMG